MRRPSAARPRTGTPGLYWGESWISPIGHGALDVVGLVPGFGEPADLLNGLWYTAEGRRVDGRAGLMDAHGGYAAIRSYPSRDTGVVHVAIALPTAAVGHHPLPVQ